MEFKKILLNTYFNVSAIINISYYHMSDNYIFSGESHDFWEFWYIDNGTIIATSENNNLCVNSGELLFHNPNKFHALQSVGNSKVVTVSFCCDNNNMSDFSQKIIPLDQHEKKILKMLINESQKVYEFFEDNPPTINMYKKTNAPLYSDQLIKNYLEQFLIQVSRNQNTLKFSKRKNSPPINDKNALVADQVTNYIVEHFNEHITLDSLSKTLGISVSQLKRVFRENVGQSMVEYLTAQRIKNAKSLIRRHDLNFTQIAEKVGYDSIYYFSSVFKKTTGMTLSEYEKSLLD